MAQLEVELEIETEKAKKKIEKDGKESGESFSESFAKTAKKGFETASSILETTAKVAAVRGATLIASAFLAARQEQVVQNLETSLRRIGEFSNATSKDIQDFASELQSLSTIGDEVILGQIAIAQSFGATADQSKRLVAASIDLAAAQGKSVEEATRQLSKTLGGYAGELGETIPILKEFTQEQLRAGQQIDVIAKQFKGFSEDSVKTFGGAVKQTTNLLGDLAEADGELLTKTPELIAVIKAFGESVKVLTEIVRETNVAGREFLGQFILKALSVLRSASAALTGFVVEFFAAIDRVGSAYKALLLFISDLGEAITDSLTAPFKRWATSATGFIGDVISFIETLPFGKILADKIRGGIELAGGALDSLKDKASSVLTSVGESATGAIEGVIGDETLQKATLFLTTTGEKIREIAESLFVDSDDGKSIFGRLLEPFSEENIEKILKNIKTLSSGVAVQTKALAGTVVIAAADINQALESALEKGAVNSFATFGAALVEGGSFLDSFLALALNTLGDLAISIGTTVIGAAISIKALKESIVGSPGVAIAAGAALVVIGGALKAFSSSLGGGGAGSSASTSASTGSSPDSTDDSFSRFEQEERAEAETRVSINIQGDVLDSDETGLRIAKILENASLNENVRIVGAFA